MNPFILEADSLVFDYDGIQALRGLSLGVSQGSKTALLGANGSGKSTFLLHLNGTLRPKTGEVRLAGAQCGYDRQHILNWRQRVGLVFQNPDDQIFAATVAQDVSFGPLNLGLSKAVTRERVAWALKAMDISDLADRATHSLSFGQKKRTAIAGVLAMQPEVLLLDEPTAGLDPGGARALLEALGKQHHQGATVVLATHDINLAYAWADAITVIDAGRTILMNIAPETLGRFQESLVAVELELPVILEIAVILVDSGLLPPRFPMPRTAQDIRAWVQDVRHIQS